MFKVAKFDMDNDADAVCKQLIASKPTHLSSKKKKIVNGKVTKRKKKDKTINDKLREEIHSILSGQNLPQPPKIKSKSKRTKLNTDTENKRNKNAVERKTKLGINQEKAKNLGRDEQKKKKKRKKKKSDVPLSEEAPENLSSSEQSTMQQPPSTRQQKKQDKLKQKLQQILNPPTPIKKEKKKVLTLRERMMQRLQAARFRYINEQIYSNDSKEAQRMFKGDPEAFQAYHEGYRQQVSKWPLNPLDVVIKSIQKLPKTHVVADFGCGDAKLAKSVSQETHSFDLVATDDLVTACDMAHVPLQDNSVDVAVFCLSLMGTNLHDYILEANRVLKVGGILKIAEVESRFENINDFIEGLKRFNFKNTWKDLSHNLFYFLDFKKESHVKNKKKLPTLSLHPCLYKKR